MSSLLFLFLKAQLSLMASFGMMFSVAMNRMAVELEGDFIEPQLQVIPADEAAPEDEPAEKKQAVPTLPAEKAE